MPKLGSWQWYDFEEVDSTNTRALQFCRHADEGCRFVISARYQTRGRGRFDRKWHSCTGNLYFSQGLEVSLERLGQVIFVSSLSLAETVKSYDSSALVEIKWPNDILLNGEKLSGTLLEKGEGAYLIIGIGVNIADSPKTPDMLYPAVSLAEAGIETTREDFLQQYLACFDKNFDLLCRQGFGILRDLWLGFAKGLGEKISVKGLNGEKNGIFEGVDENGLLLLKNCDKVEKIYAGDVFYL